MTKLWSTPFAGDQSITEWEHVKTTPKRVMVKTRSLKHEFWFDRDRPNLPEGALAAKASYTGDRVVLFDSRLACLRYMAERCDQKAAALRGQSIHLRSEAGFWRLLAEAELEKESVDA